MHTRPLIIIKKKVKNGRTNDFYAKRTLFTVSSKQHFAPFYGPEFFVFANDILPPEYNKDDENGTYYAKKRFKSARTHRLSLVCRNFLKRGLKFAISWKYIWYIVASSIYAANFYIFLMISASKAILSSSTWNTCQTTLKSSNPGGGTDRPVLK